MSDKDFSHLDDTGGISMVDVGRSIMPDCNRNPALRPAIQPNRYDVFGRQGDWYSPTRTRLVELTLRSDDHSIQLDAAACDSVLFTELPAIDDGQVIWLTHRCWRNLESFAVRF